MNADKKIDDAILLFDDAIKEMVLCRRKMMLELRVWEKMRRIAEMSLKTFSKRLKLVVANLDIALSFAPTDLCARTLNSLTCSLVKCPCESTLSRFAR